MRVPEGDNSIAAAKRTVCMLANQTAFSAVLGRLLHNFDLMYAKRSHVHWYTREGMEEERFEEARESLEAVARDYKACSIQEAEEDDDDDEQ